MERKSCQKMYYKTNNSLLGLKKEIQRKRQTLQKEYKYLKIVRSVLGIISLMQLKSGSAEKEI